MDRRLLPVLVVLTSIAVGSCADPFEPYWTLDKYRMLGVRSDPVTLKPGDVAELSVLDHVPEETSVTYEWSWCPVEPSVENRYECPLAELSERRDAGADVGVDAGGGPTTERSFDPEMLEIGEGQTAQLPYFGTKDQVLELCRSIERAVAEAGQGSDLSGTAGGGCERGYDISVRVEATAGNGETEVAKKNVTLWTGHETVNANPRHNGLAVRVSKSSDVPVARQHLDWVAPAETERDDQWHRITGDEPLPILAGMPFDLRAHVGKRSVETYRPPPPAGSDREMMPPEQESLTFRWFTSLGNLDDDQRVFVPGTNALAHARRSGWTLASPPSERCTESTDGTESPLACRFAVYSVVRDGRLGLDYAAAEFQIVGETEGAGE